MFFDFSFWLVSSADYVPADLRLEHTAPPTQWPGSPVSEEDQEAWARGRAPDEWFVVERKKGKRGAEVRVVWEGGDATGAAGSGAGATGAGATTGSGATGWTDFGSTGAGSCL